MTYKIIYDGMIGSQHRELYQAEERLCKALKKAAKELKKVLEKNLIIPEGRKEILFWEEAVPTELFNLFGLFDQKIAITASKHFLKKKGYEIKLKEKTGVIK